MRHTMLVKCKQRKKQAVGAGQILHFYNYERLYEALAYKTSNEFYFSWQSGKDKIVDKFKKAGEELRIVEIDLVALKIG